MTRSLHALAAAAILLLALALRLPDLTAGRPYINYVDEGHFLHPAAQLLRTGGWNPQPYTYPALPIVAVTAAVRLYAPLHPVLHDGRTLAQDLPAGRKVYDVLEPFEILLFGRALSLLAGLGIVVLTGLLARRLAGPRTGLLAMLFAALAPPLAIRGGFASVDPFAAFFALACLDQTDRMRASGRPGLHAIAAGLLAGCAFTSKYPAVLVLLAFGLIVLLHERPGRQKLRLLTLGGAGAVLGAVLSMPALALHTREVLNELWKVHTSYAQRDSPSLWEQAVERAEWDIRYEHPELGLVWLALTAAGLIVALRDRRTAATAWGWTLFAAALTVLSARHGFQPFRNLLPLVPLTCVLVALLFEKIRERLPRPAWADAAAFLLPILLFGLPLATHARDRLRLVDSRTQAVAWLEENTGPQDTVLLLSELAILPSELARLEARTMVRRWPKAPPALRGRNPRFFLAGRLVKKKGAKPLDVALHPLVRNRYRLRAQFGRAPTPGQDNWWHGNRQRVYVFERREEDFQPPEGSGRKRRVRGAGGSP